MDFMYSFISDGIFPSKQSWKTLVTRNIMNVETANLQCAIANEQSLHGVEVIYHVLSANLVKRIGNIKTGVLQS